MTGSRTRGTRRVGSLYITCVRRLYYVYTHTRLNVTYVLHSSREPSRHPMYVCVCVCIRIPAYTRVFRYHLCVCMCVSHVDQKKEKKTNHRFPRRVRSGGGKK